MDKQLERLTKQLTYCQLQLAEMRQILRQQADTANRRHDAAFKVMHDGFKALHSRLDRHERALEALDPAFELPLLPGLAGRK